MRTIRVELDFDAAAAVWWVSASDVPGVRIEAPSLDRMISRLPAVIFDILQETDGGSEPFELVTQVRTIADAAA